MKKKIHAAAGVLALFTIATFWTSTILVELFGSTAQLIAAKNAVLWGMLLLIPAMAVAGGSGFSLGKKWKMPLITRKKRRMQMAAANGILILVPSAFFLAVRANATNFDSWFTAAQILELLAGATNITLLLLNMKDGLALKKRKPKTKPVT